MAFGGLVETLTTPVTYDDGFMSVTLPQRAFGVNLDPANPALGTAAARVTVYIGKVINGDFRTHLSVPTRYADFTLADLKAMNLAGTLTVAGLIAETKVRLNLPPGV